MYLEMTNYEYKQSVSRLRTINHHVIVLQSNNLDFQEEELLISMTMFPSIRFQCYRAPVSQSKPYINYSIGHNILKPKETGMVGYLHALKPFYSSNKYSFPNHKVIVRKKAEHIYTQAWTGYHIDCRVQRSLLNLLVYKWEINANNNF